MRITDASLSEHIAFPEVGDLAEGTQADAPATDCLHTFWRHAHLSRKMKIATANAPFSSLTYNSDGVT